MSNVTAIQTIGQVGSLSTLDAETMQNLVAGGDCSRLNPAQRIAYYLARCEAAGLDPRAQPFAFMRLNGKEVLYAQKAASDQLAAKHGVRTTIVSQQTDDGIRVVTVHAAAKDGRETDEIGAVPVNGLKGDALANAYMKAVTKAKRRATLSICGLGMLDETEVEAVPHAVTVAPPAASANVAAAAEVLGATKVPLTAAELWDEAGREWGDDREKAWRTATAKVFPGMMKPPPTKEWTTSQCAAMEAALWPKPPPAGTDDIPF